MTVKKVMQALGWAFCGLPRSFRARNDSIIKAPRNDEEKGCTNDIEEDGRIVTEL